MASPGTDFPFTIKDVMHLLPLKVRRETARCADVNCPFCGDSRGRMNINFEKDVWRCNYCNAGGGMLALYAEYHQMASRSDAYREICEALAVEDFPVVPVASAAASTRAAVSSAAPKAASPQEIDQTLSILFGMLILTREHRQHLRSNKRGLNDEQINHFGFKSTPPAYQCRTLTKRLLEQGCTVQGVPGFYQEEDGAWTVNFHRRTAGILIPAVGVDGLLHGAQILLDTPLKREDDPPDKAGAKYIWLSSANRKNGVTSGSPVHFAGDPFARTVYVTEGLLKADIAHCLMNRSFAALAGANNLSQLEPLFAILAQNGTEQIIEAHDMDKFSNEHIARGASKLYQLAHKYGMECRRLTWNPNYKGIDDWQLALRRKEQQRKEEKAMTEKEKYLYGLAGWPTLWQTALRENGASAGMSKEETTLAQQGDEARLKTALDGQRKCQHFRLYQLELDDAEQTVSFAFRGMDALRKAGYEQPPAALYRRVWQGEVFCPAALSEENVLELVYSRFNTAFPDGYAGRSLSPSDVIELYEGGTRRYFYCDTTGFASVRFSPFLAKA